MSWRNIRLIFLREVRDQLRDRRTLFMIAVLPLLLYPALGIGMVQMKLLFDEQPRTAVILGVEHLPRQPQLLDGDRFVSTWFVFPSEAEKLLVVTERDARPQGDEPADPKAVELIETARQIRQRLLNRDEAEAAYEAARRSNDETEIARLTNELQRVRDDLGKLFARGRMQVLIIVPENFAENLERTGRVLQSLREGGDDASPTPGLRIVRNRADERSQIAYNRAKEAIDGWGEKILERRLEQAGLPSDFATPVNADAVDLAQDEQISAGLWSRLFPALLVIMAVTGAFYPAVDVAAGEKERGTMETLLICPATRTEIVLGKFFTVLLFSMSTAVLNLMSMGITGKYMISMAGGNLAQAGLAAPSPLAIMWIAVLLIPLAALFSALCLSLATFARSSKEGQYYLTPLLMVTLGLTVFCLSPGVTIQPFYSVMPVVGPALLLKELLADPGKTETLLYAIPVLVTSIGYSLLALWWAIDQFAREDVLFREAERFELKLWLRHLLRDKEPLPSFGEAGFCFVLIMLLQFLAFKPLHEAVQSAPPGDQGLRMVQMLMVQQLVVIACPALFMGILLTTSVARTFRLRLPSWQMLAVAALLPLTLHPLSLELAAVMQKWFFLPLPESFTRQLAAMTDLNQPLWLVLLAFAVAPAVCEELAFRGFILSGFNKTGRTALAIGLSSLTFGIMHMIPQQVFNATLLGLVLGLIAVRSRSLLPCIAFHLTYNALEILRGRVARLEPAWLTDPTLTWFVQTDGGAVRYTWITLLLAGAVAAVLLRWLFNHDNAASPRQATVMPPGGVAEGA